MGEKIMKDDQGLGRYLNGTDLQLIAPAEIKEVAAGWFYWEKTVVLRMQMSSLFFSCKA